MSALEGKRIVVTRADHQAAGLVAALEEAGATPIRCPTIEIAAPESWAGLDTALARLDGYGWVVFTSSNGVRAVVERLAVSGRSITELDADRVAAVGSRTARELARHGIRPAFVPAVERSSSLAETLPDVVGESILLTRADIADPGVADTMRARGAGRVDDVVAYRTLLLAPAGEALEELRRGVDGITFTSPSTVRGFLEAGPEWRRLLEGVVMATLGPVTTDLVRREGVGSPVEAPERSVTGLVDALRLAFESSGGVDEESDR